MPNWTCIYRCTLVFHRFDRIARRWTLCPWNTPIRTYRLPSRIRSHQRRMRRPWLFLVLFDTHRRYTVLFRAPWTWLSSSRWDSRHGERLQCYVATSQYTFVVRQRYQYSQSRRWVSHGKSIEDQSEKALHLFYLPFESSKELFIKCRMLSRFSGNPLIYLSEKGWQIW